MKKSHSLLLTSIFLLTSVSQASAQCALPAGPIIPDGNVASQDELIGTQKRLKEFQQDLILYRDCLSAETEALEGEGEQVEAQKETMLAKFNESVDIEEKKAAEFNRAVRAFKQR